VEGEEGIWGHNTRDPGAQSSEFAASMTCK